MITEYENKQRRLKLKINGPVGKHKLGDEVSVRTDTDLIPLDRFWRDRIKDSQHDNCVEIIETKNQEIPEEPLPKPEKENKKPEKERVSK